MDKLTSDYREAQLEPIFKSRLEYPHKDNIIIQIHYGEAKTNCLSISLEELIKIKKALTK